MTTIRVLEEEDRPQSFALSTLVFGGDPDKPMPERAPAGTAIGAFDHRGRLVARVVARPYEQWWCGRPITMCGIAGVAVRPESRGQGLVGRLLAELPPMTEAPISALFPTAPSIYRRLGWEVVGSYRFTSVPLTWLPTTAATEVRDAAEDDLPAIEELYSRRAAQSSGWLVRSGPSFPEGTKGILGNDVVTVAVEQGVVTGYASYARGRGYVHGGPLTLWDCITTTPAAMRSLLTGLAGWSTVVDEVSWRGPTDDLELFVDRSLPAPAKSQPWMLRVTDPVAAVAARGFAEGSSTNRFEVAGVGYELEVADGRGQLSVVPGEGLPSVHPRGLALLLAGVAGGRLARNGLADRDLPDLEAAFRGPTPEILDYF